MYTASTDKSISIDFVQLSMDKSRCQQTSPAPVGLIGHLPTQRAITSKASTSLTLAPVANSVPTATPVTTVHNVAAPPLSSTDIARPAPTTVSTAATRVTTKTTTMHHYALTACASTALTAPDIH
ncbi:hypothetical protein SprV_0301255800 [Sparganum proliferum]